MSYADELKFAIQLAKDSGNIMREYFNSDNLGVEWKSDNTPVTIADKKINQLVIDRVRETYKDHAVIGEEDSYEIESKFAWVVDPIDGTIPFSLAIPVSTFSLALVDRADGQPVLGVAYDPYLNNMYTAVIKEGAFLNGKRIETSKEETLTNAYVTIYGGVIKNEHINFTPGRVSDDMKKFNAKTIAISSGVYTGVKVASGQFATLIMGNGKPWDVASIALIVTEAGGVVSDLEGASRRFDETGYGCILSSNKIIHNQVLKIVKG
jgi:myo-inositol-1(or 4)-monophosphatase